MTQGPITMIPSSISYTGTSATITAQGGVEFDSITSMSVNGVFTSEYVNYILTFNTKTTTGTESIQIVFRASGTDATGADYAYQANSVNGNSFASSRATSASNLILAGASDTYSAETVYVSGPALASPTSYRTTAVRADADVRLIDRGGTHGLSTAYDGFTMSMATLIISGSLHVFGLQE